MSAVVAPVARTVLCYGMLLNADSLSDEWVEFGRSFLAVVDKSLSDCVLGGDAVPWNNIVGAKTDGTVVSVAGVGVLSSSDSVHCNLQTLFNAFRSVFELKMGRREESLMWATKAARSFEALPHDHVMHMGLIDAVVHVAEVLRRQDKAEEFPRLNALVMRQTRVMTGMPV